MEYIKLFMKGIVLGIANVIPGVSGGTMAVVFNVYDRIIGLISPDIKKIIRSWAFWFPLVLGMAVGVLAFSKIITALLGKFPVPTKYFFIGLILGSIPLIIRKIRSSKSESKNSAPAKYWFFLALSFFIGLAMVLCMMIFGSADMDSAKESAKSLAQTTQISLDFKTCSLLFLAGAAAAVAMIIPGISGSFLLLALGMYGTIMLAISTLNIPLLIPFGLGVVAGLIFGAALVRFLMAKIPSYTYAAILGLIAGSVVLIYPGFASLTVILISAATLVLGFAAAYFSSRGE